MLMSFFLMPGELDLEEEGVVGLLEVGQRGESVRTEHGREFGSATPGHSAHPGSAQYIPGAAQWSQRSAGSRSFLETAR
jgi:hypothetical protein